MVAIGHNRSTAEWLRNETLGLAEGPELYLELYLSVAAPNFDIQGLHIGPISISWDARHLVKPMGFGAAG